MHAHTADHREIAVHESSDSGTVVAPHDQAVRAGLAMYEQGGNAFDAAIAAALVSGVIEPTETTLAGSGFLVAVDETGTAVEADFGPRAPLGAHATMFELDGGSGADSAAVLGLAPVVGNANVDGPLASGVPRTLQGLVQTHARFGALPRAAVCAPAIEAAHHGFSPDAWFITAALSDIDRLRSDPAARDVFLDARGLPRGSATKSGYGPTFGTYPRITQPLLGRTLEIVAQSGPEALRTGELSDALVTSSRERGGLLGVEDLIASAPTIRDALSSSFRNHLISTTHAPSGGLTALEALRIWQYACPEPELYTSTPDSLRRLALTLRHAFADRYHWLGDPETRPVPTAQLLSSEYARGLAESVVSGRDVAGWGDEAPWIAFAAREPHDPWGSHDTAERPYWRPSGSSRPTSGTTHISAADAEGRVVAITHTAANAFGNGIMCPRTGLLFDSSMAWFNAAPGAANSIEPGGRALANMGPMVVQHENGSRSAVGASGGRRIVSAMVQLVIALTDGSLSAAESLRLPRIEGSGARLVLPEALHNMSGKVADLNPCFVPRSNDPYPMDFSRPNIARFAEEGRTISAIAVDQHNS